MLPVSGQVPAHLAGGRFSFLACSRTVRRRSSSERGTMDSSASTHPNRRVRVFGINDSPVFLDALKRFFLLEPWVDLVGTAVMTATVFQAVADAQPDVIILEPARRHATLPNIIAQLRERVPGVGIVVLTMEPGAFPHDPALEVE